jgi:outer membrane translocation and assembly module TamA
MPEKLFLTSAIFLFALGTACSKIPKDRSAVDAVDLYGSGPLGESNVLDKISTAPSPKLLGLFRGIGYDYEVYDETVLQRDLARIERYYQGHGYFEAHARAARVIRKNARHVRVEIYVEPGPPTLNRSETIHGLEGLPEPVAAAARLAVTNALPTGKPFDEDAYKTADFALGRALTDRGYAHAKVERRVDFDLGAHSADYTFSVSPGPLATFGAITIVGLDPDGAGPRPQEIAEGPVRRAIDIQPGTSYSTAQIDSATQALLNLGVFSAVHITPDLGETPPCPDKPEEPCPPAPPPNTVIPLKVELEPAHLRSLKFGGGVEFDEIKTELHLLTGWGNHNFLGGLRNFSVDASPGVVLYPLRINNYTTPLHPLPEEHFRMQLRQPGFLEARTSGFISPEFNIYPLLVVPNPLPTDPVVGYVEPKASIGVDRTVSKLFASLGYNIQGEFPFHYPGTPEAPPTAVSPILLSYVQLVTNVDLRNDPVHPHSGVYLGNTLQAAGGPFGGSATDVREQPELRFYVPLGRRVTFATRASVGFLFPFSYQEPTLTTTNSKNEPVTYIPPAANSPAQAAENSLQQKYIEIDYFRGFYSGGPNTNRGFPLRGVAPFGFVPFLSPGTAGALSTAGCIPSSTNKNPMGFTPNSACTIPIAGLSLWELSAEFRFQISGPFSTSLFCDSGDASPLEFDLRLNRPHVSCGVGARYDTPVGPIRLDLGVRIEPLQYLGHADDYAANKADPSEGIQPRIFGLPIGLAVGIGEAY